MLYCGVNSLYYLVALVLHDLYFMCMFFLSLFVQSQENERSSMYVRGIDFPLCFYGFLVDFLEISHNVVLLAVHIIMY